MLRKYVFLSVVMIMIISLFACGGPKGDLFPDSKLATAIWEAIGKPEGAIAPSDLEELITLDVSGRGLTDLAGLEYCINLMELDLKHNRISDISFLANLTDLTKLSLYHTQTSDISPLANLTDLTALDLRINQISDISPLANLTDLTELDLEGNQISDISPLASLTNLTELDLGGNQINDISPLANLTDLTKLSLYYNQISDISPLASLTNLTDLWIGYNQVRDISPLLSLPSLKTLQIRHGNPLSETSLNVYIPQLKKGGVSIPREKTGAGGVGPGKVLLIPVVAFIAALVVVLLFLPTRGGRRRGLLRSGLVVGVVLTGVYTLLSTLAITFDAWWLEDLIFWVWIPGLALYGIMVLVVIIGRKKA